MPATPYLDPSELASVRTANGWVYQLKQEDVLWAARAAARESEKEASLVLWTFTQRAALLMPKFDGMSFVKVIRDFSQPVNPIWARDGIKCRPGGEYHGTAACSEAKFKAREWYTNATWAQLEERHPEAVRVARDWARGLVGNLVPRVTNFATPERARKYLAANAKASLFFAGDNWYIVDPDTAAWSENFVTMVGANGTVAGYFPSVKDKAGAFVASVWKGATQWWRGA